MIFVQFHPSVTIARVAGVQICAPPGRAANAATIILISGIQVTDVCTSGAGGYSVPGGYGTRSKCPARVTFYRD
jgi:hypothetical protein